MWFVNFNIDLQGCLCRICECLEVSVKIGRQPTAALDLADCQLHASPMGEGKLRAAREMVVNATTKRGQTVFNTTPQQRLALIIMSINLQRMPQQFTTLTVH